MIRVSYNWNQVLARNLYFKVFSFYWKIFLWDKMARRAATRRVEGAGGLSVPQVGVWRSFPSKFFAHISSKKGIFEQF